jgi:hypothetical protein
MTDEVMMGPLLWEGDREPLAKALVAAQKNMEAVKKAATNPHFRSKYADLSAVVEAVVPTLNENGVAVIQSPSSDGNLVSVSTTLLHESGASVTGVLSMKPTKAGPQEVGSVITYARRYALLAMTGAAPEDDDGNAASKPSSKNPNVSVQPEGPDWWKAEGSGMSSAQAKKDGWGERFDEWRQQIDGLNSASEWRDWCNEISADVRLLPRGWRVQLREEAEERGYELGAIVKDKGA